MAYSVSGHVYPVERKHGTAWYAKYRLPNGQQVQRKLGEKADGWNRRKAEAALQEVLVAARKGTVTGRTGVGFRTAATAWLDNGKRERGWKPTTARDYESALRAHLLAAFGDTPVERITPKAIESWRSAGLASEQLSRRNANKLTAILHGIFEHARSHWPHLDALPNPAARVKRLPERYSGSFDFYSPEEVLALVRAAESEQDAAIYLTAAWTGLRRGELLALRWRDIDFERSAIRVRASVSGGIAGTPKSGKVRTVPMAEQVAQPLAKLNQRPDFAGEGDLVFPGLTGDYLDGSALRRRYKQAQARAKLRPLRFHDLRHSFGSVAINKASIVAVQTWMGHADIDTTRRYLHYKARGHEAQLLTEAFVPREAPVMFLSIPTSTTRRDWRNAGD